MRVIRSLLLLSFLTCTLVACGAGSDGAYSPVQDTVETEAPIRFNAAASQIEILEPGPTVTSDSISPCEIGFEADTVSYDLVSSDQLKINDDSLTLLRPLATQPEVAGVPDGLFGIWQLPSRVFEGVTFNVEIEIQESKIVYRNNCVR